MGTDYRSTELAKLVRDVKDFPKPGIVYKDITTLLKDGKGFRIAIELMTEPFINDRPELIIAMESRGFIFGSAMADRLGCGFAPVRKPGRLPAHTTSIKYDLEYGSDELHIHTDAICEGTSVLIVDDLLATGGTAAATESLVIGLGGLIVGCVFLIELEFLNGRKALSTQRVHSVIKY